MKFTSDGRIIWTLDGAKAKKFKADKKTRRCQHIVGYQVAPYKPSRQCESAGRFDNKTHCRIHSKDFWYKKQEKKLLRELSQIKAQLKSHRAKGP